MPISYAGTGLRPTPLVTIDRQYVRGETGLILRPEYTFTLTGYILHEGLSIDSTGAIGNVDGMDGIIAEQNRIRSIFSSSNDGGLLNIISPTTNNGNAINAFCQTKGLDFKDSVWVNKCEYTVTLTATAISGLNETNSNLDSASERTSITENQDGTFSIVHEIQAVGAVTYSSAGVLIDSLGAAKSYVQSKRYAIDTAGNLTSNAPLFNASGILSNFGTETTNFWNYSCVETIGQTARSWGLTETFIHFSGGQAREQYNVIVNYEADLRFANININGTIIGYGDRQSDLNLRNTRAASQYNTVSAPNIYLRLLNYTPSGYALNPQPVTQQVSYELPEGVVSYSQGYVASSGTLIPGVIDETIAIIDNSAVDIYATIPIPGRANGSLIQFMQTKTTPERTINIAAKFPPLTNVSIASLRSLYLAKPNTDNIISQLTPSVGNYYLKTNSEDWNPINRAYSRVVSWEFFNATGSGIPDGTPNILHGV